MSDLLIGAVIGGAFTLLGGLVGGVTLEAWRTRRAGKAAAKILFVELVGNVRTYQAWQSRVEAAFDRFKRDPGAASMGPQAAIAIAEQTGRDDAFYRLAFQILRDYNPEPLQPAAFATSAWSSHGAAFTTAAPPTAIGRVHGAYFAILYGEPTYGALRAGLDAAGEFAFGPATGPASNSLPGDSYVWPPDPLEPRRASFRPASEGVASERERRAGSRLSLAGPPGRVRPRPSTWCTRRSADAPSSSS